LATAEEPGSTGAQSPPPFPGFPPRVGVVGGELGLGRTFRSRIGTPQETAPARASAFGWQIPAGHELRTRWASSSSRKVPDYAQEGKSGATFVVTQGAADDVDGKVRQPADLGLRGLTFGDAGADFGQAAQADTARDRSCRRLRPRRSALALRLDRRHSCAGPGRRSNPSRPGRRPCRASRGRNRRRGNPAAACRPTVRPRELPLAGSGPWSPPATSSTSRRSPRTVARDAGMNHGA